MLGGVLIGCVAIVLIAVGRATPPVGAVIHEVALNKIGLGLAESHVRVTGTLIPSRAYQTMVNIGPLSLRGARFIPLTAPGLASSVFVLDDGLTPQQVIGTESTFVARVRLAQSSAYPAVYLHPGTPPNQLFLSIAGIAGITLGALLLLVLASAWLMGRADYTLELPERGAIELDTQGRGLVLWFGELGREYGGAMVRHAGVRLVPRSREARVELFDGDRQLASTLVRRVLHAHHTAVPTAFGLLHALRIEFEDEHACVRRATMAFDRRATRASVEGVLRVVGQVR